ncbi:MAG: hypothetical protein J6I40_00030 [Mailhella sp.]|nr:hypothetical protein [Mailhella sp.]
MNSTMSFYAGKGLHAVTIQAFFLGKDMLVSVTGGSSPHIGATALASPCAVSAGIRAYASVLSAPGHRDDIAAHQMALRLCKILGCTVCMTVGMHIDNASSEDIDILLGNADAAMEKLISSIKEQRYGS